MSFAKGPGRVNGQIEPRAERFGRLYRPIEVARKNGRDPFSRQSVRGRLGLTPAKVGKRRRPVAAKAAFRISGRLAVPDQEEFGYRHYVN